MREIPAQLFLYIRQTAARAARHEGPSPGDGLPLADVDTELDGERVDWDELAIFLDRVFAGATDEELIAAGARHAKLNEWWQLLARVALTPRILLLLDFELTRLAYPHWSIEFDLTKEAVEVRARMPFEYRGSRTMFLSSVGGLQTFNELVGFPPARVEYDVGTHHGDYWVWIGEEARFRDRFAAQGRNLLDSLSLQVVSLLERAARADRHASPEVPSVIDLQRQWGFTRAEARVMRRLAHGTSLQDIADDLDSSLHTVKSHLRSLFAKTGARTQASLVSHVLLREPDSAGREAS